MRCEHRHSQGTLDRETRSLLRDSLGSTRFENGVGIACNFYILFFIYWNQAFQCTVARCASGCHRRIDYPVVVLLSRADRSAVTRPTTAPGAVCHRRSTVRCQSTAGTRMSATGPRSTAATGRDRKYEHRDHRVTAQPPTSIQSNSFYGPSTVANGARSGFFSLDPR